MTMPVPDGAVIEGRADLLAHLARLLPADAVIGADSALAAYECDALTAYVQRPLAVVLPRTTEEVARVLRACLERGVRVVPRGAGTSLSGGALPLADGIVLSLARFNRILDIDLDNRCITAQPGVTNLALTKAVEADGFFYAPDPSSQIACTIGGNVAENSGGVHCLKYGLTTHNLLGLEIVLMDGTVARIGGGKTLDAPGYDLLGVVTGSEGLLGVVTEVTVRLTPAPQGIGALLAGFATVEAAGEAVAAIVGAGIVPAGIEMMDNLAINAAEDFCAPGYPRDAAALLIVELDGPAGEVEAQMDRVSAILADHGATSQKRTRDAAERLGFWAGRKAAFPAVGRISPDYLCMDGTIPRARLPEVLGRIASLSADYGLRCANVFHAGDGNLHPLILYDANVDDELARAEAFGADILRTCVAVGGVLTGEHGVGIEKRDLMGEMFDDTDLAVQQRLKCAFDPKGLLNPGKVFPVLHACVELGRLKVSGGKLRFADLPRF
ncbi:FAD-binding protein [Zavarzinia compransoris]|uniref:FAD-linked oxidase C-terminal domain-containing protein n=1 Tax=Zavarzinia marina TaxID=2911065 RepID=UPI001F36E474|nr:FAD-linked oxidase C-terminal domain-containing protein [Zavarzinia marina]MCF4166168.1 FAD-binding protein [Zavarzinia marina]